MFTISKEQIQYDKNGNIILSDETCKNIIKCIQYDQDDHDLERYIISHMDEHERFVEGDPIVTPEYLKQVCCSPYLGEAMVNTYRELKDADRYKELYDEVFKIYYHKRFDAIYQNWYYECGDPDYKGD